MNPKQIIANCKLVNNPKDLSNTFNNFFTSIGPNTEFGEQGVHCCHLLVVILAIPISKEYSCKCLQVNIYLGEEVIKSKYTQTDTKVINDYYGSSFGKYSTNFVIEMIVNIGMIKSV